MEKQLVLVDCDGVLFDMMGAVQKYLANRGISFNPEKMLDYGFNLGDYGCKKEEVMSAFKDAKLLDYIEEFDRVREDLEILKEYYEVELFTQAASEGFYEKRVEHVKSLGFSEDCVYLHKKPVKKCFAVIEDCYETLRNMDELAELRYLVDHPYNRNIEKENVIYVSCFHSAVADLVRRSKGGN